MSKADSGNAHHPMPLPSWIEKRHHSASITAMVLLLAVLLGMTAFRIYSDYSQPATTFNWTNRGFSDFHNGTFFPTKAFIDGKSPYSIAVAKEYTMCRPTPPYSPVVFMLHIPFALLSLEVSRIAFFVFNFALMAVLSYCSLKMSFQKFRWFDFLAITNVLLASRPGHLTMFTGYFTAEIVIGCILAVHFARTRPAISGLGLVLASIKPNFVIPLILLLAFRKNFKALIFGIAFCTVAGTVGLGWLSYHKDLTQVIADVREGQESLHVDPTEMPVNTWTRVDLIGMYAKIIDWVPGDSIYLAAMLVFTSIIGIFLWRISDSESNHGATGLSACIVFITLLLSLYHHTYDCLLLVVPAIGVFFYGAQTLPEVPRWIRMTVAILLTVPAVNYASTKSAMELMSLEPLSFSWQAVTLVNGICLLMALILLLYASVQLKTATDEKI